MKKLGQLQEEVIRAISSMDEGSIDTETVIQIDRDMEITISCSRDEDWEEARDEIFPFGANGKVRCDKYPYDHQKYNEDENYFDHGVFLSMVARYGELKSSRYSLDMGDCRDRFRYAIKRCFRGIGIKI